MTKLDIFINVFFATLGIVSWAVYRFAPTYISIKPSLWNRYKQWRLKKYFEKHGGERNARNYR